MVNVPTLTSVKADHVLITPCASILTVPTDVSVKVVMVATVASISTSVVVIYTCAPRLVTIRMAVISVKESRDSQDGHGSLTDPRGEIKRKIFAHSSVLLVFST